MGRTVLGDNLALPPHLELVSYTSPTTNFRKDLYYGRATGPVSLGRFLRVWKLARPHKRTVVLQSG